MNHLDVPVPLQLLFADVLRGPSLRVALTAPGAPALHAEVARVQTASVAWAREFGLIDASQVELRAGAVDADAEVVLAQPQHRGNAR